MGADCSTSSRRPLERIGPRASNIECEALQNDNMLRNVSAGALAQHRWAAGERRDRMGRGHVCTEIRKHKRRKAILDLIGNYSTSWRRVVTFSGWLLQKIRPSTRWRRQAQLAGRFVCNEMQLIDNIIEEVRVVVSPRVREWRIERMRRRREKQVRTILEMFAENDIWVSRSRFW